jgi:trans-aconitate methyltransferase
VTFEVSADAYGRFMGRYSEPLAERFVELVGARPGQRALDVGCGPGALTSALVSRLGADAVTAVDPSVTFVSAARERLPDVDVRSAAAESLPFADAAFDLALAQLVVHFMSDPVAGIAEMARVTRPAGVLAASVWDNAGDGGPLSLFWRAVHDVDPGVAGEAPLAGSREGHLAELFEAAGLDHVRSTELSVDVRYDTFEQWWEPYTMGVGPAGGYVARLDERRREAVRDRCRARLPKAPFEVTAKAWVAVATR